MTIPRHKRETKYGDIFNSIFGANGCSLAIATDITRTLFSTRQGMHPRSEKPRTQMMTSKGEGSNITHFVK